MPTLASALVALFVLSLLFAPAPLNLLKARLLFTVEDISFKPILVDGEERTAFTATVQFENLGPVRIETLYNLLIAALSEEGGVQFDTMNDFSSAIENGEVRTLVFDGQLIGSWDTAVFWVKVSVHDIFRSYQRIGYFWLDQPLILEV